jgi:hypothetical protein
VARDFSGRFFFLQDLQSWQQIRAKHFKEATKFDKDAQLKKDAGIENLNKYANEYELQTISSLFHALTPENILEGDDTFYTKHLLSNLERSTFEKNYSELLRKKAKK